MSPHNKNIKRASLRYSEAAHRPHLKVAKKKPLNLKPIVSNNRPTDKISEPLIASPQAHRQWHHPAQSPGRGSSGNEVKWPKHKNPQAAASSKATGRQFPSSKRTIAPYGLAVSPGSFRANKPADPKPLEITASGRKPLVSRHAVHGAELAPRTRARTEPGTATVPGARLGTNSPFRPSDFAFMEKLFVNNIMASGKKSQALKIFYAAKQSLFKHLHMNPFPQGFTPYVKLKLPLATGAGGPGLGGKREHSSPKTLAKHSLLLTTLQRSSSLRYPIDFHSSKLLAPYRLSPKNKLVSLCEKAVNKQKRFKFGTLRSEAPKNLMTFRTSLLRTSPRLVPHLSKTQDRSQKSPVKIDKLHPGPFRALTPLPKLNKLLGVKQSSYVSAGAGKTKQAPTQPRVCAGLPRQRFVSGAKEAVHLTNSMFSTAVENVKPWLEVRKVKIAGTLRQVPSTIPEKRALRLAIKWIIEAARQAQTKSSSKATESFSRGAGTLDRTPIAPATLVSSKGIKSSTQKRFGAALESQAGNDNKKKNGFFQYLAQEVLNASRKRGWARQKRDELHKLALSNRASVRFRWW